MQTVTVYNTDSVKAREILSQVSEDDVLTENLECVAKVYIEQCFFESNRRFDKGLFDIKLRLIGTVDSLFIEDYDDRQFPCGTKNISFMDAEPVMISYMLTAEEQGHLVANGVTHPGFEPPANMKYNVMEIPVLIEYKGIYESPVCFTRIIRPNEIQTSTKKCGYYGLFNLVDKHPDVIREEENGGIDINLTKASPELKMTPPAKQIAEVRTTMADKVLKDKASAQPSDENASAAHVREAISERLKDRNIDAKASDETVKIYNEAVAEYEQKSDITDKTNVSDIGADTMPKNAENVLPYTVRKADSDLYSILSQKVEESADRQQDSTLTEDSEFDGDDKSLSKAEKDKKKQIAAARRADIAADNKALNEDASADISGQGATTVKKTSAQDLLSDIALKSNEGQGQQFL